MSLRGAQLTFSETATWKRVKALVQKVIRENHVLGPKQEAAVYELDGIADDMLAQLQDGVHRNPALVVYNPVRTPAQVTRGSRTVQIRHVISKRVLEIGYEYGGHPYKHDVETPAILYAVENPRGPGSGRSLWIVSPEGLPLWASDAEVQSGRIG